MTGLSKFDQMLTYTSSKIAHLTGEFEKHHDKMPGSQFKTMTSELRKAKKKLSHALEDAAVPEFDNKLLTTLISYIDHIKKETEGVPFRATRQEEKMIFLDVLADFHGLLKDLDKKTNEKIKYKAQPVVKIKSIVQKGRRKGSETSDLNNHLSLTETRLGHLHKLIKKSSLEPIGVGQYKELITVLKKANVALVKARAMHEQFSGQYQPDYNRKTMRKIFNEINFLQNNASAQMMAGTAQSQINLFWQTLKEFQSLLQDLEEMKKTRGKTVAHIEKELFSG
jgi:hypothetical protein